MDGRALRLIGMSMGSREAAGLHLLFGSVHPEQPTLFQRITKEMNCHPERKGPQAHFISGVPGDRSSSLGWRWGVVSRRICICFSAFVHETKPGDRRDVHRCSM